MGQLMLAALSKASIQRGVQVSVVLGEGRSLTSQLLDRTEKLDKFVSC
jgi:hypothetical protein